MSKSDALEACNSRFWLGIASKFGLVTLVALSPVCRMQAQDGTKQLTTADYARADQALPWNAKKLILNLQLTPHWIEQSDRFWYKSEIPDGWQFLMVDPTGKTRKPVFDHARLASALSSVVAKPYTAQKLPFDAFEFADGGKAIEIDVEKKRWRCDLTLYRCQEAGIAHAKPSPAEIASPNKHWVAFVREHNLYVRSMETKQEIQLTHDGKQYDDYATSPDMDQQGVTERIRGVAPIGVIWSPDSSKLLTYKLDQTKVRDSYLIQSVVPGPIGAGRPVLYTYRYALPGDPDLPMAKFLVFDLTKKASVTLEIPPQSFQSNAVADMRSIWWSKSGRQIYCVQRERLSKTLKFSVTDGETGATRTVIEEHGPTLVETIPQPGDEPLVPVLDGSDEAIWYSERDGWGHLYLYDLKSAKLKNQITSGAWVVREIKFIDAANRWLYFTASGREKDRNPYSRYLYRIHLDGTNLQLLTPEDADHQVTISPDGRYFLDTYSRIETIPISKLKSMDGKDVEELEKADIHQLMAKGFVFPEPFKVVAADGKTEIYGAIYRPSNFDASKRYPIVDSIYPGPQRTQTAESFFDSFETGSQAHSVAELGFVVITVDGRGTPLRSKAFHDYAYGNLGDAGGLEDHVAAIQQLAAKYPFLNLDEVGIYGHSGGGYATVRAMLEYPDFYKVGVSSSGEQDMRGYLAMWGERYEGPLNGDNYVESSNPAFALRARLKGKLLLAWGDMDDNVPPALEWQLVHSLIATNQDFDTLVFPNRNHSYSGDPYFIRRRWDYLVENLLGAHPPKGYQIKNGSPTYRPVEGPEKEK